MFLDVRVTLATFVTAIGLALVMFAVGTRAWVASERAAPPSIDARAPLDADPFERGFGVSPASARSVAERPSTISSAAPTGFLATPKAEPAAVDRMTARETPAPVSGNVIPGPGAVVQERFDVLHEPSPQLVTPRNSANLSGPVPLPRPRANEPAAATSASIAGPEPAAEQATRPKTAPAKRADTNAAAKKHTRQSTSYFESLFGSR